MSDTELIKERKKQDARKFLISGLDSGTAPRLAPALRAMRAALLDGHWHPWSEVLAAGLRESDVAVHTATNALYSALSAGMIERRGEPRRKRSKGQDSRELHLLDWPERLPGQ